VQRIHAEVRNDDVCAHNDVCAHVPSMHAKQHGVQQPHCTLTSLVQQQEKW